MDTRLDMLVQAPVSPALGRLRQKNPKFKASLGYIVRRCP
jgi:hypothetical protein